MSGHSGDDARLNALAMAAACGDRRAVEAFVTATQRDVIRFVGYLAGPSEAEDLAQETFLRAMRALPSFEGRSSARTWLLAIARHTVLDHLRSASRRPRLAAVPDWVSAADEAARATRVDERIVLEQLIAQLVPERREAFVATQILGLSYVEAAELIGCPVGTIRSRVARAREDLTAAWAADGATPPRQRHLRAI